MKINVFYGARQYANLSNLAKRPFSLNVKGKKLNFVSVEHGYQTLKNKTINEGIYKKPWKEGSKFTAPGTYTKDNWNINLMRSLMRRSFEQNPTALAALKATGKAEFSHVQDRGIWKTKFPELLKYVRSKL